MLPAQVRRAVSSASQAGLASALTKAAVGATQPVFVRGHQRRFSSSKPSRSDNGSDSITASASVPAGSTKASGEKRKRKAKDSMTQKLPSVPSTHHMSEEVLGLSSFFSLHRPISVTQTMPRSVTDEHFASIFSPASKSAKVTDTMATLSDVIDELEGPMASMTIGGQHEHGRTDDLRKVDIRNADGSESRIYMQVDAMTGDFLPYRPPPAPTPQTQATTDANNAALAEAAEQSTQHRVYRAVFTIEESTESDGQVRVLAHSPQILQDEQPRSFLERLALRQLRFNDAQDSRRDMHALSVKRIRKLRMKKKKYKKLMKRTRNERRKLEK